MPALARILIYPLKSFDAVEVDASTVLGNGALQYDRQFALVDAAGKFLNAKRTARVHPLMVRLNPLTRQLVAQEREGGAPQIWEIDRDRNRVNQFFSDYFLTPVTLQERGDGGFPDDTESPGPTVVSTATLEAVAHWFPGLTVDQVRKRFRANLEIRDTPAFWEDRLVAAGEQAIPFRIGTVLFEGTNPCQRCVVPTRDPGTGEIWPEFARQFAVHRETELPPWAPRSRFSHFYRLTVNTRRRSASSPEPATIQVGDVVVCEA